MNLSDHLIEHDVWLTGELLDRAARLPEAALDKPIVLSVEVIDDDPSIRRILDSLVRGKERWAAILTGTEFVASPDESLPALRSRWAAAAPRYLEAVRRISAAGDWDAVFVDASCSPPRTFTHRGAVAHVLTFSAYRRTLLVAALHDAGVTDLDHGDPMHFERP